jgi:preprotein translocase subunit SecA
VYLERDVVLSRRTLDETVGGEKLRDKLSREPCGLHVIGSERHEARRIDRQLRGRCARQGDPGSSRFYVSLEDDLMRMFASDRLASVMSRLGLEEGQDLQHRWLNRSIETAQRRVEQQNFAIRKRTLEYDDVMNKQREIIYSFRGDAVRAENVRDILYDLLRDRVDSQAALLDGEDQTVRVFVDWVRDTFPIGIRTEEVKELAATPAAVTDLVFGKVRRAYELKVSLEHPESVKTMERYLILNAVDSHWQDYLRSMDNLREGVGLRAYGQRDPLLEYKKEAYHMFGELMDNIKQDVASVIFRASTTMRSIESFFSPVEQTTVHDQVSLLGDGVRPVAGGDEPGSVPRPADLMGGGGGTVRRDAPKVGRNDPCPCGSGKKYKKCCGK